MKDDRKTRAELRQERKELREKEREERAAKYLEKTVKFTKKWIVFAIIFFAIGLILFLSGVYFDFGESKLHFGTISIYSYLTWAVCCLIPDIINLIRKLMDWDFGENVIKTIVFVVCVAFAPAHLIYEIVKKFKWLEDPQIDD